MRIKRNGESGSTYLRHLKGQKDLEGEPLRRMEKLAEVSKAITHIIQF